MNDVPIITTDLNRARHNLRRFVEVQAAAVKAYVGFGWVAVPNAPDHEALLWTAYRKSVCWGDALPVSSLHCADTIFMTPQANHAMRFWHDMTHIRLRAFFTPEEEAEVATAHLDVVRSCGFPPDSLEHQLMRADTFGQIDFSIATGTFPRDQLGFAIDYVRYGVATAIERHRPLRDAA